MPSSAGDTGERVRRRRHFVLWDWDEMLPMVARLTVLVGVAYFAGKGQTGEVADAILKAEEAAATTQEIRAAGDVREADAYEDYYELVRYHAVSEAECDGALEVYERHMGDPHEWAHVLESCHTDAPVHEHATVEPPA